MCGSVDFEDRVEKQKMREHVCRLVARAWIGDGPCPALIVCGGIKPQVDEILVDDEPPKLDFVHASCRKLKTRGGGGGDIKLDAETC